MNEIYPPKLEHIKLYPMKKLTILAATALVAFIMPHDASARSKKSAASPTPAAAATPAATAEKSARAIPYHGVVTSVDKSAKTFTIVSKNGNTRIFTVTSESKITNRASGSEATLNDINADSIVGGSGWKKSQSTNAEGKKVTNYDVKSVKIGAKAEASANATPKAKHKKHAKDAPAPSPAQ